MVERASRIAPAIASIAKPKAPSCRFDSPFGAALVARSRPAKPTSPTTASSDNAEKSDPGRRITSTPAKPTSSDSQRPLLTEEKIAENIAGIKGVFEKFLTFGDGPTDAVMLDNDEWLSQLGYLQFLRDYGTHFTINRMLSFDSVKLRLDREQPLTFLEFNYMLMQATDFLELNRRYGCSLQMGGSDQWGNIINGVELTRKVDHKAAFGLTTPLLSTASGQKMGKTVGGAVWLNADALSPFDYWQYWRNTEDADVERFLKLYTAMPLDEIASGTQIDITLGRRPEPSAARPLDALAFRARFDLADRQGHQIATIQNGAHS